MPDQETAVTTADTKTAETQTDQHEQTQETQTQETAPKYDYAKFNSALESGAITAQALDDIANDLPNWLANINKANRTAADEKNKAIALRTELEKRSKQGTPAQRIEKPEDHPAVKSIKAMLPSLISKGMAEETANELLSLATQQAQVEIERQDFVRVSDLDKVFGERAKEQQELTELQTGATQLTDSYKGLVDADTATNLIAAFSDEEDTPGMGFKKAKAFIESVKTWALKQEKPKPKPSIASSGAAVPNSGKQASDDDKFIAEAQARLTAQELAT